MLSVLASLALSLLAVVPVYYSWRQRGKPLFAAAGWLLAIVSVFAWSHALGPEIGTVYAIMVFVCLTWSLVVYTMDAGGRKSRPARRPYQSLRCPALQSGVWHGAMFLLSVPAAGVISMMVTVALVFYLPWTMPAKAAVVIFVYPVLWGGMSAWMCAQEKLLKPVLASVGLLAISGLVLFA